MDGGAGLLQSLGVRFLDIAGVSLVNLPESLVHLASVDLAGLDSRVADCPITVMCDVDNPLLGLQGAAAVFGPQKGAGPAEVSRLEAALARWSQVLSRQTGLDIGALPHGGAAGGVAAALAGLLGARLVKGIDHFLDLTDMDAALTKANLVVTGEGSIDEQTLAGKAPAGVAARARALGVPVIALAGQVPREASAGLRACFDVLLSIGEGPVSIEAAMAHTAQNLRRTAQELGNALALDVARESLK